MRRRKKQLPKYAGSVISQVERAQATGTLIPGLHMITVRHDDWCELLNGKGPCNCDPDVEMPQSLFPPENN